MSEQEIPPWLKEQLARYEQLQQNLQSVMIQKQQVDMELSEVEKALEELKNSSESDQIYKYAGSLLIKVKRENVLKELDEKKELASTRSLVLAKQENRFRENLRELQTKIDEAVKGKIQPEPKSE